ncbi:hypothetical protein CI238_13536, partial [Colletotrichum incanum]
ASHLLPSLPPSLHQLQDNTPVTHASQLEVFQSYPLNHATCSPHLSPSASPPSLPPPPSSNAPPITLRLSPLSWPLPVKSLAQPPKPSANSPTCPLRPEHARMLPTNAPFTRPHLLSQSSTKLRLTDVTLLCSPILAVRVVRWIVESWELPRVDALKPPTSGSFLPAVFFLAACCLLDSRAPSWFVPECLSV